MASVAALAALDPQPTPDGAALEVALASGAASLAALDLQQASGEAAPSVKVASVTASLAAQDPQLTPDGVTLAALVVGKHRLAPWWATLVTSVLLWYKRSWLDSDLVLNQAP